MLCKRPVCPAKQSLGDVVEQDSDCLAYFPVWVPPVIKDAMKYGTSRWELVASTHTIWSPGQLEDDSYAITILYVHRIFCNVVIPSHLSSLKKVHRLHETAREWKNVEEVEQSSHSSRVQPPVYSSDYSAQRKHNLVIITDESQASISGAPIAAIK